MVVSSRKEGLPYCCPHFIGEWLAGLDESGHAHLKVSALGSSEFVVLFPSTSWLSK
jgi:hypothetical protein